jgi:hypothetical protein
MVMVAIFYLPSGLLTMLLVMLMTMVMTRVMTTPLLWMSLSQSQPEFWRCY